MYGGYVVGKIFDEKTWFDSEAKFRTVDIPFASGEGRINVMNPEVFEPRVDADDTDDDNRLQTSSKTVTLKTNSTSSTTSPNANKYGFGIDRGENDDENDENDDNDENSNDSDDSSSGRLEFKHIKFDIQASFMF